MTMTWDEFKRAVDEALARAGETGDVRVWYIDLSAYSDVEDLEAHADDDGLAVWS